MLTTNPSKILHLNIVTIEKPYGSSYLILETENNLNYQQQQKQSQKVLLHKTF